MCAQLSSGISEGLSLSFPQQGVTLGSVSTAILHGAASSATPNSPQLAVRGTSQASPAPECVCDVCAPECVCDVVSCVMCVCV